MFLPRSRQLTAMGKEGVYLENQEDHLSIHGDGEDIYNQSQYSPKKYKDSSSRCDRQTIDAHSDEVYQNGSYLGKLYDTFHTKNCRLKILKRGFTTLILNPCAHIWHNCVSCDL